MLKVYLDTSAFIKRYLEEEGSTRVDSLFDEAYRENAVIITSQWNIGEVAVVLDKYHRRGIIPDVKRVFGLLYNEMSTMVKMNSMHIIPVLGEMIANSLPLIFTHQIYIADALQIETCRYEGCDQFFTFDRKLNTIAVKEGLQIVEQ